MNGRTNSTQENSIGALIPLEPVTDLNLVPRNKAVRITWEDPLDKYTTPGDDLVTEWEYTNIIRKEDNAPISPNDGILILHETIRNQYIQDFYTDDNLTNGITYYYAAYAYSTNGLFSDPIIIPVISRSGVPVYYKQLDSLNVYSYFSGTVDNKYIFAGGNNYSNDNDYRYATVYDDTLSKSSISLQSLYTYTRNYDMIRGIEVPDYFVIPGYYEVIRTFYDIAISTELTQTQISDWSVVYAGTASTSINEYCFVGGCSSYQQDFTASAISNNLTCHDLGDFNYTAEGPGATKAGNYAIFGGGYIKQHEGTINTRTTTFNTDLTIVSSEPLSKTMDNISGASIGNYGIFIGNDVYAGSGNSYVRSAEAYDNDLTHIMPSGITQPPGYTNSDPTTYSGLTYNITLGTYAMCCCIVSRNNGIYENVYCLYDEYLTYSIRDDLVPPAAMPFDSSIGKDPYGLYTFYGNYSQDIYAYTT